MKCVKRLILKRRFITDLILLLKEILGTHCINEVGGKTMPSKLTDHIFNKGKFTAPLNTLMTSVSDDKSWTYGRLPEYLWIGLIFKQYGRNVGLEKVYKIIHELHHLVPELIAPRISSILELNEDIQVDFYARIFKIISKETLAPLTLVLTLSSYPEFAKCFYCKDMNVKKRQEVLLNTMKELMDHQTHKSTDIRFVVLYFECMSGRLQMRKEELDLLLRYPYLEHDNEEMRMVRPMVRSMELMTLQFEEPDMEYLACFWEGISTMTECRLMSIQFPTEEKNIAIFMEQLHEIIEYLTNVFQETAPLDDKMQVLLGIATYSYKRLKEAYEHKLFNSISGRSCVRILIENYIMMKYLVKNETSHENIWRDYQFYGIGLYKLVLARHRENTDKRDSHFDELYIEALVNEFVIEESIDMDTRYFDKTNIRGKAESVDEKDLYGLYYDYDSSYEHGLWGAIRESSMVKCDNPAHQYHCVPDIEDANVLKTVLPDCIVVIKKTLVFLNDIYGIPPKLFEEVMAFDSKSSN